MRAKTMPVFVHHCVPAQCLVQSRQIFAEWTNKCSVDYVPVTVLESLHMLPHLF